MDFGVVFPTTEIGTDPVAIRGFAQAAEELGYAYVVAYDHVLGAVHENREPKLWGPYTEQHPFHEPFVLFGFLAGVPTRLELETAVIILPSHRTGRHRPPSRRPEAYRSGSVGSPTWRCDAPLAPVTASPSGVPAARRRSKPNSCVRSSAKRDATRPASRSNGPPHSSPGAVLIATVEAIRADVGSGGLEKGARSY